METPVRGLIFDPFSGISGDMILGALIDLGLSADWLEQVVDRLGIDARIEISSTTRGSIAAHSVTVVPASDQPARRLADILEILDAADIGPDTRATAASVFQRLANAEAAVHGVLPDEVHFHEVGAADAIVDVVAAADGVGQLRVQDCFTRPVAIGHGWIDSAHGSLPVPAPATLRLLQGLPVFETGIEAELTTPTGAAILAVLTRGRRAPDSFTPVRSGFGAGSRDHSTHPNCLRLTLIDLQPHESLFLLQADIDDMSPEYLPPLLDSLLEAGATDVSSHPVQMKKGRTGIRLDILVSTTAFSSVSDTLFSASSTLGFRFWPLHRQLLPRSSNRIKWRGLSIRFKSSIGPDGHVHRKPEYDDVIEAARTRGVPAFRAKQEIERLLDGLDT